MTVSSFLSLAGAILGLVGLVGGSVAVLAAGRQKSTIDVLQKNNDALQARVVLLEKMEGECQVRLAAQEGAVRTLTETVTNAKVVADTLTRWDLHHADLLKLAQTVEAHFQEVLSRLDQKVDQ